jgi:hypothetical protein
MLASKVDKQGIDLAIIGSQQTLPIAGAVYACRHILRP